jgi:hypothetical protein
VCGHTGDFGEVDLLATTARLVSDAECPLQGHKR